MVMVPFRKVQGKEHGDMPYDTRDTTGEVIISGAGRLELEHCQDVLHAETMAALVVGIRSS